MPLLSPDGSGAILRPASRQATLHQWMHATPADALAALDARGLIPTHWSDSERGPRWWCEACRGTGLRDRPGRYPCFRCDSSSREPATDPPGHTAAPPSHPALVAVASLGVDTLARAEAIVAEAWRARVVFRVMTAEALDAHGEWTFSRAYAPGESHAPRAAAIERHTGRHLRSEVPEACDHGDQHPSVVAAWPALRALAALGLHLVAVDDGRVTLAVEAP